MRKKDVVIIPFNLPWNWSADYQRQTALELARRGNFVIAYFYHDARFILKDKPSTHLSSNKNIVVYQPTFVIPFRRFLWVEQVNHLLNLLYLAWRFGKGMRRVILWIFDPIFWFYPLARLGYPCMTTLYDCVDYVWSRNEKVCQQERQAERLLIQKTDYFFVNSHVLYNIHKKYRKPDAIVPQGFCLEEFKKKARSPILLSSGKPIIGYVGAINHRIDFLLLERLVRNNPQWNFVIWGAIQETDDRDLAVTRKKMRSIALYPNVIIGKSRNRSEIASVIEQFDIGIIPYDVRLDAVRYCYPMKVFEYFYCGKPVLTTPIDELRRFSKFVWIGKDATEWEKHIVQIRLHTWPDRHKKQQRVIAIRNSWDRKVSVILSELKSK